MFWVLGWTVSSSAHNTKQIKQNIQMSQEQNKLKEETLELIYFLKLTMVQVS